MKKQKSQKKAADIQEMLVRMASFYAGKPVTVQFGDRNTTGVAGSSQITVNNEVRASLERLLKSMQGPGKLKEPSDIYGLATLIHEALHTRGPDMHDSYTGNTPRDPRTGFYSWDDEWQARQLGAQLVPDAMQRFFGIPMNSKTGKAYEEFARQLAPGFGSPPKDSVFGERNFWF